MLHTEKEYNSAMRQMILRVQQAASVDEINTWDMSIEEAEILLDCVASGYLIGKVPKNIAECRTLDGKAHPELFNTVITPKGLAFLKPPRTDLKATIALIVSAIAALISLLSNADQILHNIKSFLSLIS